MLPSSATIFYFLPASGTGEVLSVSIVGEEMVSKFSIISEIF